MIPTPDDQGKQCGQKDYGPGGIPSPGPAYVMPAS
jgi:hypothetical protein